MRHVLAAVLCIALPLAMFAAENGYKVTYDGGLGQELLTFGAYLRGDWRVALRFPALR